MKFFNIDPNVLIVGKDHSFRIFIYQPRSEQRTIACYEHTILSQDMLNDWNRYRTNGAKFQIHILDEELFLQETKTNWESLKNWNADYFLCLEIMQQRQIYKDQKLELNLRETITKVSETNNFMPLINYVRSKILCFDLTISSEVSLTTVLVEKLFVKDIKPVRVATLVYLIATNNKITDPQSLCEMILACLLRDLGQSLISQQILLNEDKHSNELYLKHPMLSIFMLSKAELQVGDQVKRYILEHHEQEDGSGFPRGKKGTHNHRFSYILNMSEQIVDHFHTDFSKDGKNLVQALNLLIKQLRQAHINPSFPMDLTDSLMRFIQLES